MSIRSKLLLSIGFFITIALSLLLVLIVSTKRVNEIEKEGQQFEVVVSQIFELDTITNDYFLYHETRSYQQWHIQYQLIANLLAVQHFTKPSDQHVLTQLQQDYESLNTKFVEFTELHSPDADQTVLTSATSQLEKQLVVELLSISRSIVKQSSELSARSFTQRLSIRHDRDITIFALVILLISTVVGILLWLYSSLMRPLHRLQSGIEVIAAGDLGHTITTKTHDEMGKIADSFNVMARKLLISFSDLEKFKMAVEYASDQIIITDTAGIVLYANQATETITGYTVHDTLGKKAGQLWGGQMDSSFYSHMWSVLTQEKKSFTGELTNKRKNGKLYITEIHISPVLDEYKNILFFVSLERDISAVKAMDKAKTEFVAIASHALRTPLGIIKWYLEDIQADVRLKHIPKKIKDHFTVIFHSNQRLLHLVRNLLSISRIDQGKVTIEPELVDVLALLKSKVVELVVMAGKNKIVLHAPDKGTISKVWIDRQKLQDVIENLIINAIKYNIPGGKIDVRIEQHAKTLTISVADTGIGISEEDQKKLFTKFFRSAGAVASDPDGTGLGLYVVKAYVTEFGGTISVRSKEGKGSTFTITIPMKTEAKVR